MITASLSRKSSMRSSFSLCRSIKVESRISPKDRLSRLACRKKAQNIRDSDAHAANAWATMHAVGSIVILVKMSDMLHLSCTVAASQSSVSHEGSPYWLNAAE